MSDSQNAGFGQFVPGFDFLQNLTKGTTETLPQMPNLTNWIAPTLNLEELDKRITELKAVHFWLDQNSKALGATVQALEVQKMTLATLKGLNFNIGDMAHALKPKAAESTSVKAAAPVKAAPEAVPEAPPAAPQASKAAKPAAAAALVDPLQLWGALTQQFQQIAASALKDAGAASALDAGKKMAADFARPTAPAPAKKASAKVAKARAPARKTAGKTSSRGA